MAKKSKKKTTVVEPTLEETSLVKAFQAALKKSIGLSGLKDQHGMILVEMVTLLDEKNLSRAQRNILTAIKKSDDHLNKFAELTCARFAALANYGKSRIDSKHTRQKTMALAICTSIAIAGLSINDVNVNDDAYMLPTQVRNKSERGKLVDILASRTKAHAFFSSFNPKKTGSLKEYIKELTSIIKTKAEEEKKESDSPRRIRNPFADDFK